jgi:predicted hotdog family 3-hydroxylacyl-ACP dehydratase
MNSNELSGLSLEDLLPHRASMLLIDQILEVDSGHAITLSRVAGTWPLTGRHGVSPLIMVELAAQTAGVCTGWDRIRTQGLDSDQMGWLVAVKRADFFIDHLPIGTPVMVKAENTLIFENFREVSSRVYHEDRLIAEVVLQLYQA